MSKVINETTKKLKILAMLNTEFFEEVRKIEEGELQHIFGSKCGKLLYNHAILEEKFQSLCVEDWVKMTPLDEMYEEGRQCALDLKTSTLKLIREFSNPELALKLQSTHFKKDSNEFGYFIDTIEGMCELYDTMLSTPKEEVQSIQANLSQLSERISQLK